MTLLNKDRSRKDNINKLTPQQKAVIEHGPVNIKKGSAKDRRPIQANPEALDLIRRISYAKNIPMYAVLDDAMLFYRENGLTDVERELFDNYITPKTSKLKKNKK